MKISEWVRPAVIALILMLAACATHQPPQQYLLIYDAIPRSPHRFVICNDVSCDETVAIQLSDEEWRSVRLIFHPPAIDAESERGQIAKAVARLERLVGRQAGTSDDQPRNGGSFRGTRQLDCVAETTNTTIYLLLMEEDGLLQWHGVGYPKHRGLLDLQFPHNTAVLIESGSNRAFAVDSYFHANGIAPEIVPLAAWEAGYDPES
jgi:hypothetical protein